MIDNTIRQTIADAADAYLTAYLDKEANVTAKETIFEDAIDADEARFDSYNIPFPELQQYQTTARNLYSELDSAAAAYDSVMEQYEPTIIAFLSEFQSSAITFPDRGKKLTLSAGEIVVSDL